MEERLDTYDVEGNYLGVRSREECHSENPGFYHKPVWIWIINNKNEILVQKRSLQKKKSSGKFDMPSAGHIDAGESLLEGCVRETKEELGIQTKESDYILLQEFVKQKGWELVTVYLLKTNKKIEDMVLQKEEVETVKYLSFAEFEALLYSDQFCNHSKNYKDFIIETLPKYFV